MLPIVIQNQMQLPCRTLLDLSPFPVPKTLPISAGKGKPE